MSMDNEMTDQHPHVVDNCARALAAAMPCLCGAPRAKGYVVCVACAAKRAATWIAQETAAREEAAAANRQAG